MARQFSSRMVKQWTALNSPNAFNADLTAAGTSSLASVSQASPGTILRIRGRILVTPQVGGAFAAGDECHIGLGFMVVSADQLTGSFPDPIGDAQDDWMWQHVVPIAIHSTATESLADSVACNERIDVDVRAMRRIKTGQGLALFAEYVNISGIPPVSVYGSIRALKGE